MRLIKRVAAAAVTLSLCACSWTQSVQPMVPRQVPEACLKHCQPLPAPKDGSDRAIRLWEYDIIDESGNCRRLHSACVDWHTKEN